MLKKGHFLLRTLCHITQHNILSTVSAKSLSFSAPSSTTGLKVMKLNFQDSFPLLDWLLRGIHMRSGRQKRRKSHYFVPQQLQTSSWASVGGRYVDASEASSFLPKNGLHCCYILLRSSVANPLGFLQPSDLQKTSLWLQLSEFPESQQYPPQSSPSCPVLLRVMQAPRSLN